MLLNKHLQLFKLQAHGKIAFSGPLKLHRAMWLPTIFLMNGGWKYFLALQLGAAIRHCFPSGTVIENILAKGCFTTLDLE